MRVRGIAALLVSAAAALAVTACGDDGGSGGSGDTSGGDSGRKVRIGLVLPDLNNPYISAQQDGAKAEAEARGFELLINGSNDGAEQVNAFETFLAQQVDLIAIETIDARAMGPAVEKANEQGVPVLAMQSPPASGEVETYLAPDNEGAGEAIGTAIAEYCRDIDPCKLGVVEGSFSDPSGVAENRGMRTVVGQHPNIEIVGGAPTNYDPARALNVASDLLTAHPDINYLYSWWDQGALAALEAVRDKGREGRVGISGFTGICEAVAEVIRGNFYQEPMYLPYSQAQLLIAKAAQVLDGEDLPAITPWPFYSITTPAAQAILAGREEAPEFPPADITAQFEAEPTSVLKELRAAEAGC